MAAAPSLPFAQLTNANNNAIGSPLRAALGADEIERGLQQARVAPVAADEFLAQHPERMYEAFTNAIKGSNVVNPNVQAAAIAGLAPNQLLSADSLNNAIIKQFGSVPEAQRAFSGMSNAQRAQSINDLLHTANQSGGSQGLGPDDLSPVATAQPGPGALGAPIDPSQVNFEDPNQVQAFLMQMGTPISQAQAQMETGAARNQAGVERAGISAEGRQGYGNIISQGRVDVANINHGAKSGGSKQDEQFDRESLAELSRLSKQKDMTGGVPPEIKRRMRRLMEHMKTPKYKQLANDAFGKTVAEPKQQSEGSGLPVSTESPVPGATLHRSNSDGKLYWLKDGKPVGTYGSKR